MILLWKAMVFQVGVHGLQAHPQKFWFAENLGKKGSNVVWLEKMAPKVCIKIHEDLFFEVTPKRGLHDFCGWKYIGRSCTKSFSGKFGEIRGKSFAPQTFCLLLHLWWKGTSAPLPLFRKGRGENALAMPPFSSVPMHIFLHALPLGLLVVVGYNVSLQWT